MLKGRELILQFPATVLSVSGRCTLMPLIKMRTRCYTIWKEKLQYQIIKGCHCMLVERHLALSY